MLNVCNRPLWVVTATVIGGTNHSTFVVAALGRNDRVHYGPPPVNLGKDRLGNRDVRHGHIDGTLYHNIDLEDKTAENLLGTYHYGSGTAYGVPVWYTGCSSPYHIGSAVVDENQGSVRLPHSRITIRASENGATVTWSGLSGTFEYFGCTYNVRAKDQVTHLTPEHGVGGDSVELYNTGDTGPAKVYVAYRCSLDRIPHPMDSHDYHWFDMLVPSPFFVLLAHKIAAREATATGIPDAIVSAVSSIRLVSINSLAYLGDVAGLVNQYRSVKKDLKKASRGNKKAIANLYLSWEYGMRLFIQDSSQLIRAFRTRRKKMARHTFRGRKVMTLSGYPFAIKCQCNATVYVEDMTPGEVDFYRATRAIDLFPSTANLWDLVPFSFAIDWCVDVGGFLERLDASLDVLMYPVLGAELSTKLETPLDARHPFKTDAKQISYDRWSESQKSLASRLWSMTSGIGEGLSLKHALDGLMLLVQRSR